MKTSTVEVGELVSSLSAAGVHRQLSTLPGVHQADLNCVVGSATVHCDEARVTLDAIRQRVVDCGYHCCGELAPVHVWEPADHCTVGDASAGDAGHLMPGGADGRGARSAASIRRLNRTLTASQTYLCPSPARPGTSSGSKHSVNPYADVPRTDFRCTARLGSFSSVGKARCP